MTVSRVSVWRRTRTAGCGLRLSGLAAAAAAASPALRGVRVMNRY